MSYEKYECVKVQVSNSIARVVIDHPPINLFDMKMILEMEALALQLERDNGVKVVVMESANPDFFIAHADVDMILRYVDNPPPDSYAPSRFQAMTERFRTMPKATIGKLEGIVRGGGSELLLALDMRFAARGKALLSQPEVALGILPGGGGTQRLARLVGRAKAAEIVLGCGDFPADLAEQYGWINRALPPEELGPFVDALAARIASYPAKTIALAKASLNAAESAITGGLAEETRNFHRTVQTPEAVARMQHFMKNGGQTPEVEKNLKDFDFTP